LKSNSELYPIRPHIACQSPIPITYGMLPGKAT
jgi:hypothetical protein